MRPVRGEKAYVQSTSHSDLVPLTRASPETPIRIDNDLSRLLPSRFDEGGEVDCGEGVVRTLSKSTCRSEYRALSVCRTNTDDVT